MFKHKYKYFEIGQYVKFSHIKVSARGSRNRVQIGNRVVLENCEFHILGRNNTIIIDDNVRLNGVTLWVEDNNNIISIGKGTTIGENSQIAACEGTSVNIGVDCMFSHSILVRTTDSHSIIDESQVRINKAESIQIGDHVWVGLQTLILKGVHVPDNSIIGARSTVSSSHELEPNCVIVGSPAKVVKRNINWIRDRI